jgi:ABC-type multidrug transport system fused ATPase/permease subunit
MHGRTTFVIAHRLSTVHSADMILVLDQGRIAARGRHEDLLKSSPLYAGIYHQQFKSGKADSRTTKSQIFFGKKDQ